MFYLCIYLRFVYSLTGEEPLVERSAQSLAKATIGLGRVVLLPNRFNWLLKKNFGKQRSVFNGAIRAYMPGFSIESNPFAHPLFVQDAASVVDYLKRAEYVLRWMAATHSIRQLKLGEDILSFSAVREYALDFERARLKFVGSDLQLQLDAAQNQIDALKDDLLRANETESWLLSEHQAVEEKAQNLEQQLRVAKYRIQMLLEQIEAGGGAPDAGVVPPTVWSEFADWCDNYLGGRVVLSARATREVKAPFFESPQTAARCLMWLANEYRDARINGSDGDLRKFIEEGVRNDRCGADAFSFEWNQETVSVDWHIKNNGNTRDPQRCLRIYYFWDDQTQQVVVASMPGHARTGAS